MIPEKFTLLIVDAQNDLIQEDGKLFVPSCEYAVMDICKFINDNSKKIDRAILAKSNHPVNYCLFKGHGGSQLKNCVEETKGAEIDERIISSLKNNNVEYYELNHGEVAEFEENSTSKYSQVIDDTFVLATATDARRVHTEDIVICGMLGDTLIADTIKDLVKQFPPEHIHIFVKGVANVNKDNFLSMLETFHDVSVI